jgi:hypothetical protein
MGIHVLANQLANVIGGFEPQRQNNWGLVVMGLPNEDILSLSLVTGFLPRRAMEEVPISYGNEVVYVSGKPGWDQGVVTVRDFIDRPTAKVVYDWSLQVYDPRDGHIGLARDYKKEAEVVLFAPNTREFAGVANPIGQRVWTLHGVWPSSVNFAQNGLDQTSADIVRIELVLRYDKAEATQIEASV